MFLITSLIDLYLLMMYVKNSSGICHTFMHAVQCHAVQCHAVQCHAVQCHAVQCYSIMLTDYSKWRITQCCAEDSDVAACDKVVTVFAALTNLSTSIVGKKLYHDCVCTFM